MQNLANIWLFMKHFFCWWCFEAYLSQPHQFLWWASQHVSLKHSLVFRAERKQLKWKRKMVDLPLTFLGIMWQNRLESCVKTWCLPQWGQLRNFTNSFCCTLLYCTSYVLCCYKLKAFGNPAPRKSDSSIFLKVFAQVVSSCHILVILTMF